MQTIILFTMFNLSMASTYFQRVGWISPSPSYGHVHLTVDLQKVEQNMVNMMDALTTMYFTTMQHPKQEIKQRCQTFLINAKSEVRALQHKFDDYNKMTALMSTDAKRVKRFFGLIAIGMATTSLAVGLYNTAEIAKLKASMSDIVDRQHHITDILQEHEVSIHNVQHNLDTMKTELEATVMVVEDIAAMQAFLEAEILISNGMEELHRMVDCITLGTERLLMHRLPFCFTNTTNLIKAHQRLSQNALERGLSPVQASMTAYLEHEISFVIQHKLLHIFVHVPLTDRSHNLELLKFVSVPIPISPAFHMKIDTNKNLIAISSEGFHTTISTQTFEQCRQLGEIFFCPRPLVLKRRFGDTCLGSIYMQNYTNLQQKCPVVFFEATEIVEVFSSNTFMMYTKTPQTIRVNCKHQRQQQHIAVDSSKQIKLDQGCTATTENHVFQSGFDISINDAIQRWPTIWNISNILFDVNAATLHDIVKRLDLIDSTPTPIRDIKKMVWMNSHQNFNLGLSIVIAVIAILIIGGVTYLIFRYFKVSKVVNNPNVPSESVSNQ